MPFQDWPMTWGNYGKQVKSRFYIFMPVYNINILFNKMYTNINQNKELVIILIKTIEFIGLNEHLNKATSHHKKVNIQQ